MHSNLERNIFLSGNLFHKAMFGNDGKHILCSGLEEHFPHLNEEQLTC